MATRLVQCPGCGRSVHLVKPRVLAAHRWPVAKLQAMGLMQMTATGEALAVNWPRCSLSGVVLDDDPPAARLR